MALETLRDVVETSNGSRIIDMNELKNTHPNLFPDGNQMDYKTFESDIRPFYHIYVRHDVNSVSFTIQDGPVREKGVNGCQVTDIIEIAKIMIEGLNAKFPCRENAITITKLEEALLWQAKRTKDRERRGVEGLSRV